MDTVGQYAYWSHWNYEYFGVERVHLGLGRTTKGRFKISKQRGTIRAEGEQMGHYAVS